MADDKILQTYPSPDDKRWIELRQRPDGRFYFQEFSEAPDNVPEYGPQSNAVPGMRSGAYESFQAAESDMHKIFPWLCAKAT